LKSKIWDVETQAGLVDSRLHKKEVRKAIKGRSVISDDLWDNRITLRKMETDAGLRSPITSDTEGFTATLIMNLYGEGDPSTKAGKKATSERSSRRTPSKHIDLILVPPPSVILLNIKRPSHTCGVQFFRITSAPTYGRCASSSFQNASLYNGLHLWTRVWCAKRHVWCRSPIAIPTSVSTCMNGGRPVGSKPNRMTSGLFSEPLSSAQASQRLIGL
jgi:hypothetical protein